jgi:hypothetical protein
MLWLIEMTGRPRVRRYLTGHGHRRIAFPGGPAMIVTGFCGVNVHDHVVNHEGARNARRMSLRWQM